MTHVSEISTWWVYSHGSLLFFNQLTLFLDIWKELPGKCIQGFDLYEEKMHKMDCVVQEKSIELY